VFILNYYANGWLASSAGFTRRKRGAECKLSNCNEGLLYRLPTLRGPHVLCDSARHVDMPCLLHYAVVCMWMENKVICTGAGKLTRHCLTASGKIREVCKCDCKVSEKRVK